MRVTFYDCGDGTLGVQYLLSVVRQAGHEPHLFFDHSFNRNYLAQDLFFSSWLSLSVEKVCASMMASRPDVLCFPLYTYFYLALLEIIHKIKRDHPDVIIICGGIHTTLVPEVVLENAEIDFAVVGEAEQSLPELLRVLQDEGLAAAKAKTVEALPGVWNTHDGTLIERGLSPVIHDLNTIPFPDKDLHCAVNPTLKAMYNLTASRGCFNACSYCNSATVNTLYRSYQERYYRVRSVTNVMDELLLAVKKYRPRYIEFFDDVFGAQRTWLQEFCRRYKAEIGLPFGIQTSPLVHNEENLRLLADTGCVAIEFGLQSANAKVRCECLNRREKTEDVANLVRLAVQLGMFVELDFIVNLPGEEEAHLEENLSFLMATRPQLVNIGFLQYFPKTPITEIALAHGVIQPEDVIRFNHGEVVNSMRLLAQAKLSPRYRTFPIQAFFASRLPEGWARKLIALVNKPVFRGASSFFASAFLYVSRVWMSISDHRNFFPRRQIIRTFYGSRWVLSRKLFGPKP